MDVLAAITAVWRIESPKVVAAVTRVVRDVGLAEDAAQEAFLAAIEQWPGSGIPDKPGAWLTTTAKRRAIDQLRRAATGEEKYTALARELEESVEMPDPEDVEDDLLRLMFIACHPVLSSEARVALTLKMLGGLTTNEVARAFLVSEPAMAQRIVRAKRTLNAAKVDFVLPSPNERPERLASVLEAIYLIYNEGYTATSGEHWIRAELCEEALRLGRVLAGLMPDEAEVHGLVALMELQTSRFRARTGPGGEPVRLLDQERSRWDRLLIARGLRSLERAEALGPLGPYALQAAIAACHARAPRAEDTDWELIAALYDALAAIMPSVVVELNRAVAVAMAFGPAAGLELADRLVDEQALRGYHLLPSVRADLLQKLGRFDEARDEFLRAAELTGNHRERALLEERAASVQSR